MNNKKRRILSPEAHYPKRRLCLELSKSRRDESIFIVSDTEVHEPCKTLLIKCLMDLETCHGGHAILHEHVRYTITPFSAIPLRNKIN